LRVLKIRSRSAVSFVTELIALYDECTLKISSPGEKSIPGGVGTASGRNGNLLTAIDQPERTHTLSYTDFNEAVPRKVSNYINESLTRPSFYSSTTTAKIITTAINDNAKQSYIKIARADSELLY